MSSTSKSHRSPSQIGFALAEDGDAIGTVHQFSDHFTLPESQVLPCLQCHDEEAIVLRAGPESAPLLILGAEGVDALRDCATSASPSR